MSTSRLCVLLDRNADTYVRSARRQPLITEILDYARAIGCIVVTLDADFHTILVVAGMSGPFVIKIRLEGLKGAAIAKIIQDVLTVYAPDLANGCMITVKKHKTTCYLLRASE